MRYAMLVMDLDGTLLQDDKQISLRSQQALSRCRKVGIRLVLASARPRRGVLPYAMQINADAMICHNGAVTESNGWRRYFGITPETATQLLQKMKQIEKNICLCAEINDTLFANFDARLLWPVEKPIYTTFAAPLEETVDKLIVKLPAADTAAKVAALLPEELYLQVVDGGTVGLIMNRQASKFRAVCSLAQQWGIQPADVIAFGDDRNDAELLRQCGCGVAMGNALPEVKAVANAVTAPNSQDGVALWIEQNML